MTAGGALHRLEEIPVPANGESLRILIVGGSEAGEQTDTILESLGPLGFGLVLVGVAYEGTDAVVHEPEAHGAIPVLRNYAGIIADGDVDLVIVTSDDHELRKRLVGMIHPRTRMMDSFALKALQGLKSLAGKLGSTQERLRTVELIKEVIMQGSEVSIMVVDEDFRVLDINNAILKRTKMSREGCLGRDCHWVIHRLIEPCHLRGESCVVREVLSSGCSAHNVREEKRSDGQSRYFTRSAYPLGADERGKRGVLIVWKDVTGAMAPVLDRQVRNVREDFQYYLHQDKMMALGKLAAAAVHEINNPIQGILTFSKLMRSALDQEALSSNDIGKFRTYLDLISDESARCGHILRNLLSFSRQGELKKSNFFLNSLLDEIILLIANRMQLQGISLCREIGSRTPMLFGDRNQIKQAILNLLLNSIDAMPTGGLINIDADIDADPRFVRISVTDTGPGVPQELRSNVFEPFFTTKQNGKGVGLGLSVVYGIVTQHGGMVSLESQEGKGATFMLTIPAAQPDPVEKCC